MQFSKAWLQEFFDKSLDEVGLGEVLTMSGLEVDDVQDLSKISKLIGVGEIVSIDPSFMKELKDSGVIPIIAPIGMGDDNKIYNINADVVASKVAEVLNAEKLVLMTNTKGVLDKKNNLISSLIPLEIKKLIDNGTISDGMLPKINSAVHAAKHKVNTVHIIDGRVEHALLLEILTDQGVGTLIKD